MCLGFFSLFSCVPLFFFILLKCTPLHPSPLLTDRLRTATEAPPTGRLVGVGVMTVAVAAHVSPIDLYPPEQAHCAPPELWAAQKTQTAVKEPENKPNMAALQHVCQRPAPAAPPAGPDGDGAP